MSMRNFSVSFLLLILLLNMASAAMPTAKAQSQTDYPDVGYVDVFFNVMSAGIGYLSLELPSVTYTDYTGQIKLAYPCRVIWLEKNTLVPVIVVNYDTSTSTLKFLAKLNFTTTGYNTYRIYYSPLMMQTTFDGLPWAYYNITVNNTGATATTSVRFNVQGLAAMQQHGLIAADTGGAVIKRQSNGTIATYWIQSPIFDSNWLWIRDSFVGSTTTNYTLEVYPGLASQRNTSVFLFFDDFNTFSGWSGNIEYFAASGGMLTRTSLASSLITKSLGGTYTTNDTTYGVVGAVIYFINGTNNFFEVYDSATIIDGFSPRTTTVLTTHNSGSGRAVLSVSSTNVTYPAVITTKYYEHVSVAHIFYPDVNTTVSGTKITVSSYPSDNANTFQITLAAGTALTLDCVFFTRIMPQVSVTSVTSSLPSYNVAIGGLVSIGAYQLTMNEVKVPVLIPVNVSVPLNFSYPAPQMNATELVGIIGSFEYGRYLLVLLPLILLLAAAASHTGAVVGASAAGIAAFINYSLSQELFSTAILGWIAAICVLLVVLEQKGRGSDG